MEKIEEQLMHDVIKHDVYAEWWRWDVDDIANKLNELVENYNELYKMVMRLERIRVKNNEDAMEETINKRRIAGCDDKPDTPGPKPAPRL